MKLLKRAITKQIQTLLTNFPVIYLNGPRQAGKTTLVKKLSSTINGVQFLTFDDAVERSVATRNPQLYLRDAGYPIIIDEAQLVPDLFRPLKLLVDEQRFAALQNNSENVNGRYILTGSANLNIMPKLADAMVGRMATITLLPLSAAEYIETDSNFITRCFLQDFESIKQGQESLTNVIQNATFPEISSKDLTVTRSWMSQYINKITLEDPQQLYNLEKAEFMPSLLQSLAIRTGNLINDADISRDICLTSTTTKTYRNLLTGTFIVNFINPWFRNIGKRMIKSQKVYFYDTMLLCHLLNSTPSEIAKHQPQRFGHILENFVYSELCKQNIINNINASISFYRTRDGKEVDFILEQNNKIVGIEVKNTETISNKHLSGMRELQSITGKDFVCGVILCNTPRVMRLEEKIYLVPISALWQ